MKRFAASATFWDLMYFANEGKIIAIVPKNSAEKILDVMRQNIYGKDAQIVGEVTENRVGRVGLQTKIGSVRIVDTPIGNLVPRIC